MEKRRVGTRFLDHEVTEADLQRPMVETIRGKVHWYIVLSFQKYSETFAKRNVGAVN